MAGASAVAGKPRGLVVAWLLALAPAAMLAVLLARPVWDVDVFWQLKLGELILANHGPLLREPFAAAHLGQPMPSFGWLGQAVMAQARLLGGWTGLRIFDALCWLGGFLAVAAACRQRSGSAAGVLLALAIAFFAALPLASIRPQSFAALCFGALLALLRLELKPGQTLVLALPLLLVWQNLHPSVSVAAAVLGVRAALGWWAWLRRAEPAPREMTVLTLAAGLFVLATPDGLAALRSSAANAAMSAAMGVSEWLPLWDAVNRFVAVPVLLVAVVVSWLLLRSRRPFDPGELAVAIVLFAMTLAAYRFVLFWALSLIPLVARAVPPPPIERRTPAWLSPVALILTAIAMPLLRQTHFAPTIPLAALERLHASGAKGTIFTHFPWGGPAIDVGYPDWRVAYDGRYYRYTPHEWDIYRAIAAGRVDLAGIDRTYRPTAFVLDPRWNRALIAALRADRTHWREVAADGPAIVFQRKMAAMP